MKTTEVLARWLCEYDGFDPEEATLAQEPQPIWTVYVQAARKLEKRINELKRGS